LTLVFSGFFSISQHCIRGILPFEAGDLLALNLHFLGLRIALCDILKLGDSFAVF
jgi:uncharacterized membrane protein YadS